MSKPARIISNTALLMLLAGLLMIPIGSMGFITTVSNDVLSSSDSRTTDNEQEIDDYSEYEELFIKNYENYMRQQKVKETTTSAQEREYIDYK